jgi:hypothetical protein
MKANILLALWSLILAAIYAWIAYTSSNNRDTALSDLWVGGIYYVPLVITALTALIKAKTLVTRESCWALLIALTVGTGLMAMAGYNFAGMIVGFINIPLCILVAVKTLQSISKKDI